MRTGRPRDPNKMIHTAVVLPADLRGAITAAGEANGRGLSGEIRAILEGHMARIKGTDGGMVQTSLWLPLSMHAALKNSKRGFGGEIRQRLSEWQMLHDQGYRVEMQPAVIKVNPT